MILLLTVAAVVLAQTPGVRQRMARPDEYGNVVMNNGSEAAKIAPVVFSHWLHRAKYTCRLCHVDLGFAMVAGRTGVREQDNRHGLYCGACHDGKLAFAAEERSLLGKTKVNCERCHSLGKDVALEHEFYDFVGGFPRARFGNRVDWLVAEEQELITLQDQLAGVSIARKPLKAPLDTMIDPKAFEMPNIIFSHEKHAVWNGCELCHPQIFGVRKGSTVYEMQDIFDGKYCGACHGKVAFLTLDCQLCHTEEVQ